MAGLPEASTPSTSSSPAAGRKRDLRIDWLRGLAMTCVIVDHSRLWSLLSWFTYERFWIVTAAEVFVVLSGIVLGTVYGDKLLRHGWLAVVRGLGRRALTLYVAFLGVTLSLLLISMLGIDVTSLTGSDNAVGGLFKSLDPLTMNAAVWRDLALMRFGPWPFEIVGLYVWLVAAAAPCLLALRLAGWRVVLAGSWLLYFWYRIDPHALTTADFEKAFPIMAWQLLFVHGIAIGYHRESIRAFVNRASRAIPVAVISAAAAFVVFALCNPWTDGPSLLRWSVVSPDRFTALYFRFFTLTDLGIGRILNLAVALPVGYALLTWCWKVARPLGVVFVTLGRQSLAAFVLQVYGVLLFEHLTWLQANDFWINTLAQAALVLGIAALLEGARRLKTVMSSGGGRRFAWQPRDPVYGVPSPLVRLLQPAEPAPMTPEHP
jgi:hypothetical protein